MDKRKLTPGTIVFVLVLLAGSVGYDFWRGYREAGGSFGGIMYVIFGFGILAILWLIRQAGSNSQS